MICGKIIKPTKQRYHHIIICFPTVRCWWRRGWAVRSVSTGPVHTCGSGTLFSPALSHTYYEERDPLEEESSVFTGGFPFRPDNTGTLIFRPDNTVELNFHTSDTEK